MESLINLVYVDGDLVQSLIRLVILVIVFDCVLSFAALLGSGVKYIN